MPKKKKMVDVKEGGPSLDEFLKKLGAATDGGAGQPEPPPPPPPPPTE